MKINGGIDYDWTRHNDRLDLREISIGNYFWYYGIVDRKRHPDDLIKMTERHFFNPIYDVTRMIDHMRPIELTEELLERLGFEKRRCYVKIYGFTKTIEVDFDGENSIFLNDHYDDKLTDKVLLPNGYKYVHQLQNLYYSLTGEELLFN